MRHRYIYTAVLAALLPAAALTYAEEAVQNREQQTVESQVRAQSRAAYGWQLMTPEERATHRAQMRSQTSVEAREQLRLEHHRLMQERAQAQGYTLPAQPVAGGGGAGRRFGGGGRR
jgi:hypothetical protein